MIEVRGLRKSYGPVEAVRGIDLTVDRGEIVAFLGPNGAGKTTTLEILAGHRRRDAGEATVLGFDPGNAPWGDLAVLALWTLVGARIAVKRFRWDPVAPGSRRREREPDVGTASG